LTSGFVFSQETSITPESYDFFVPDNRIIIKTEIADPAGIQTARCYFKAEEQADMLFVDLENTSGNNYEAILPAPSETSESLNYQFLAVNNDNQVAKTKLYEVPVIEKEGVPPWQTATREGDIQAYTELSEAPEEPPGFNDSIAVDVVESSARFGMVAGGIYTATEIAAAGGASGAASQASVTTAAATGTSTSSTAKIVGVGAGVVLLAAAVGLASSSDSDDGEEFMIEPSSAQLIYEGNQTFTVSGGDPPYTWNLSNPEIGNISPTTGTTTTFQALREGSTQLTVTDSNGNTSPAANITVTPNLDITVVW
jgi:hypothetical protein